MNRVRTAFCWLLFTLAAPAALAQTDPLTTIGRLMIDGHAAEARTQILALRGGYFAQDDATGEAAVMLLLALSYVSTSDTMNVRQHLRDAETKYDALEDHLGVWLSLWLLGEVERRDGHLEDALAVHERAQIVLARATDPAAPFSVETLKVMAAVFGAPMGNYPAEYLRIARPLFLRLAGAIANYSHAHLLIDSGGDLAKAEELLNHAATTSRMFGGLLDSSISRHLGELRLLQWRLDEARELYVQSLDGAKVIQTLVRGGPLIELTVLAKLAEVELFRGRIDDALAWNDRALALAQATGETKRVIDVIADRADLLQKGGDSEAALAQFDAAVKMAAAIGDARRQASLQTSIGTLHMFKGRYGSAVKHLEQAIAFYQSVDEPLLEAGAWMILAEVHNLLDVKDRHAIKNARALAKKSKYKLAEATIDLLDAFDSLTRGSGKRADAEAALNAWRDLPETKTLLLHDDMLAMLREALRTGTGQPMARLPKMSAGLPQVMRWTPSFLQGRMQMEGRNFAAARRSFAEALKHDPPGDLRAGMLALIGATHWLEGDRGETIRFWKEAIKALDVSALDVKVEELLSSYLGSGRRVYFEIIVDMLVQEGRADEAFVHAERARARAFLQLVGNHRFNAVQGANPALVREAEILRTHIIERERQMKDVPPTDAQRIADDLKLERDRYRTLLARVKATSPEYAALTDVEPLELDAIRKEIPADSTLVSYFVTTHAVHVWVVDGSSSHHAKLPVDAAGMRRIVCWAGQFAPRESARGVALPNACGDAANAAEAFDKLLAPIAKTIRTQRLILVPHGPLHYVPFAALHDKTRGRDLIDDYVLTYAPSASTLRFLRAKETPVDGKALVLGDPVTPLAGLNALPGAEQEAATVARRLGTKPYLREEAREALLYGLGGKFDLVHLAAHGLYDANNPLFSRVALAAGESHDGSLTVDEILSSVDLGGVNLVVLSGCRTAAGERTGGDEVVGLTRALLYAGTPGVLSTLWNIDDSAAATLMDEFYRRLSAGASAAEALRHAQLAIRERLRHPKYWAAFTLHGDPQGRWTAR
ncbi:MAG TPA: CHAT domain-containing tetratricopeptide repeat protein [Thermoanaerobaculia bacterium]